MNVRQATRNIFSNWMAQGVAIGLAFFVTPFVVGHLGHTDYGIWTLVMSITGCMGFMDFGIRTAVIKYVAESRATNNALMLSRVMSASVSFFLLMGVVIVTASGVIGLVFPRAFGLPLERWTEIQAVVVVAGATLAAQIVFAPFHGALCGTHRFDLSSSVRIAAMLLNGALVVGVLGHTHNLVALAATGLCVSLIEGLLIVATTRLVVRGMRISWRMVQWGAFRQLASYGSYNVVFGLALRGLSYADVLFIGAAAGAAEVTVYSLTKLLCVYIEDFLGGLAVTITPAASEHSAREHPLDDLVIRATKLTLVLAGPAILFLTVFGTSFFALWLGPGFEGAGSILTCLALAAFANVMQLPLNAALRGGGVEAVRFLAWAKVGQVGLNVALSWWLIGRYGLPGVALGTAIASVVVNVLVIPVRGCALLKVSLRALSMAAGRILAILVPAFGVAQLLVRPMIHASWMGLSMAIACSVGLFLVLAGLGFDRAERSVYVRGLLVRGRQSLPASA
ncbi:MAG: hypothetical protein DMD91_04535 [Candidatus Rokuibacteriota bacterium]|nr:MAG: hypothetical protein DMD91_04535 [Candidatus Rokubacteria bacterium]